MADTSALIRNIIDDSTGLLLPAAFTPDRQLNGFNIERFRALTEGNRGFQKPSKFLARIPIPSSLLGETQFLETGRDLSFWCDAASLPGAALQTRDVARYGYGMIEKRPVRNIVQDLNFTFYADGGTDPQTPNTGTNWNFFTTWVRSISNFNMSQGLMMPDTSATAGGSTGANPLQAYEIAYKASYVSNIEVHVFRPNGSESHAVVLRDAFPTYVQEITVRWGDDGAIMQIPVLFAFTDWYLTNSLAQG
jgi:hypothetical protein